MAKEVVEYRRPPGDFNDRNLLVEGDSVSRIWYRIAKRKHGPVYYNRSGDLRFDSPDARWGVCYVAPNPVAAMSEVYGEAVLEQFNPILSADDLEARNIYRIKLPDTAIRFCPLFGPNLMRMKCDMNHTTGRKSVSQEWARAIMDHPQDFHGLLHVARQAGVTCLAFFGPREDPESEDLGPILENDDCVDWLYDNGVGL